MEGRAASTTMALIGNGSQSEFQALAMKALFGIDTVTVFDPDPAALAKFTRNMAGMGLRIVPATSAREAVRGADFVVVNPTHYAVAIKYSEGSQGAPRVVAKGADLVALRIRDVAREAKVPVLRAPPLARALYASTDLEQEIPLALYSAVAQVLAHVFQLREAMAGRAPYPGSLPAIPVPAELDPHDPRHTGRAARGAPAAAT